MGTHEFWYENFADDLPKQSDFFLMLQITSCSFSPILYAVINNETQHSNLLFDNDLLSKYMPYFKNLLHSGKRGIYMYRYDCGEYIEQKYISHYNVELFNSDVFELLLFQEYGLNPRKDERKEVLQKSIKAEKIKDTLVYACYLNDNEKIFSRLEKASKTQLNKKLQYYGTPLGLCAENDNLSAFKAIAEKGADLNKVSLAYRPLQIAFKYSPDIVFYIYENFREQFDKEVKPEGFGIAYQTTDVRLLQLLKDYGCDMNCNGAEYPPLHNFADNNNVAAIQFFADNGADFSVLNKYKQTALERAESHGNKEAAELLKTFCGRAVQ